MEVCLDLNRTVTATREGMGVVAGDFNAPVRRSWLAGALGSRGLWSGWRRPYQGGTATNVVCRATGVSRTENDHVLVSPALPCTAATLTLFPGLSTHVALLCDLGLALRGVTPLNPTGR